MPAVVSELPSPRPKRLVVQQSLGAGPANHEQELLESWRDIEVERPQTGDPLRICDVLDRRLNQTLERHHPDERQHRQQNQCEGVEGRPRAATSDR